MLQAIKTHLKNLSVEDRDEFYRRVALRLQFKASPVEIEKRVAQARSLILAAPTLMEQITQWGRETELSESEKGWVFYLNTKTRENVDYLPKTSQGLMGYLEEAYMVGKIYELLRRKLRNIDYPSTLPGVRGLDLKLKDWLHSVKTIIPQEAEKISSSVEAWELERSAHGVTGMMSAGFLGWSKLKVARSF